MSTWVRMRPKMFLLPLPAHDRKLLPSLRGIGFISSRTGSSPKTQRPKDKRADTQMVQEFRAKLRLAEEMISKLAFNLREIQGAWRKTS